MAVGAPAAAQWEVTASARRSSAVEGDKIPSFVPPPQLLTKAPRAGVGLLAIALLLIAVPARSDGGDAPIFYSATGGCPDERAFRQELASHRRAQSSSFERPIVVEVAQLEQVAVARVRFTDESGFIAVRELSAPGCAEVMGAAALVVALAIDSGRSKQDPLVPAVDPPRDL